MKSESLSCDEVRNAQTTVLHKVQSMTDLQVEGNERLEQLNANVDEMKKRLDDEMGDFATLLSVNERNIERVSSHVNNFENKINFQL